MGQDQERVVWIETDLICLFSCINSFWLAKSLTPGKGTGVLAKTRASSSLPTATHRALCSIAAIVPEREAKPSISTILHMPDPQIISIPFVSLNSVANFFNPSGIVNTRPSCFRLTDG